MEVRGDLLEEGRNGKAKVAGHLAIKECVVIDGGQMRMLWSSGNSKVVVCQYIEGDTEDQVLYLYIGQEGHAKQKSV